MIVIIYAGINTATFDSHDTILGSVDVPDTYEPDIEDDIMTLSVAGKAIEVRRRRALGRGKIEGKHGLARQCSAHVVGPAGHPRRAIRKTGATDVLGKPFDFEI